MEQKMAAMEKEIADLRRQVPGTANREGHITSEAELTWSKNSIEKTGLRESVMCNSDAQCTKSKRARTLHTEFGVRLTDPTLVRSVVNIDAFAHLDPNLLSWNRVRKLFCTENFCLRCKQHQPHVIRC